MRINELISINQKCFCGKHHHSDIEEIYVGEDCWSKIATFIKKKHARKIALLCESIHERKDFQRHLKNSKCILQKLVIQEEEISSEESLAGKLLMKIDPKTELVILIGSGEFVTACRYICSRLHFPIVLVLTGPSDITCCSSWVSIHENGIPHFHKISEPLAVYADTHMISAHHSTSAETEGLLQIYQGHYAVFELYLGHLIADEYFCPFLQKQYTSVIEEFNTKYFSEEDKSKRSLFIVQCEIALSLIITLSDSSKLSCGTPWLLYEFWNINFPIFNRLNYRYSHYFSLEITCYLIKHLPSYIVNDGRYSPQKEDRFWKEITSRIYGAQASYIHTLAEHTSKNSPEKINQHLHKLRSHTDSLFAMQELLPDSDKMQKLKTKAIEAFSEIYPDSNSIYNALLYAKDMVSSYNILQLYYDLGALRSISEQFIYDFENNLI